MELIDTNFPARLIRSGREKDLELVAGKCLKIETSPEGQEILNVVVPTGKKWIVNIAIDVQETNA